MDKIIENSLKIAELMGYVAGETSTNNIIDIYYKNNVGYSSGILIKKYSSYNTLMPFVFECNQNDHISFTMTSTCVHVTEINTSKPMRDRLNDFPIGDTEPEFIQAIQLAVIKYLKLRG